MAGDLRYLAARIKERVLVPEAASWFGFDYTGRAGLDRFACPLCREASTSKQTLSLLHDGATWHCFHCDVSGDVIDWIAARMGTRKGEAIANLATRLGLTGDARDVLEYLRSELSCQARETLAEYANHDAAVRAVRALYWAFTRKHPGMHEHDTINAAAQFAEFERLLAPSHSHRVFEAAPDADSVIGRARQLVSRRPDEIACPDELPHHRLLAKVWGFYDRSYTGSPAEAYVTGRNPGARGLGYCRPGVRVSDPERETLRRVGVARWLQSYWGHWMDGRLVFPIDDLGGRVVGFAGREVHGRPGPKYLNTPDTEVFSKGQSLYGIQNAASSIVRRREAIVVEGYMDVEGLQAAGVTNTVATMGTALTRSHFEQLSRLVGAGGSVVTVFDPDDAGRAAADKSVSSIRSHRTRYRSAMLPEALDPDEFVLKHGADGFRSAIRDTARPTGPADADDLDRLAAALAGRIRVS